ncbi:GNAT family N-acetyltransferase [Mycobacterium spongiae]|nr:GNAT family protein [Mycobacterium spongiae]
MGQPEAVGNVELYGQRVVLRRATIADAPAFRRALNTAEVARWWEGGWPDPEGDLAKLDHQLLAIVAGGDLVGMIQWHQVCDPVVRFAGIDMFVHPDYHRRGYGSDALRTLLRWLFTDVGHHRVTIDPAIDNVAAIRCYEQCGFRRVGVMRQYERTPDDGYRDGLLMELLACDFRADV